MRVFMLLDADGAVKSFFAEDLFGPYPSDRYPAGAIEITLDQWQDFRDHQGSRRWDAESSTFIPYDPGKGPSSIPDVISDRQCFQQLAVLGKVSQDEAVAAVSSGALPKTVTDGIAGLPTAQQFPARMLLCGATEFHRSHPMVLVFLSFFGLGESDRDALWTAAAAL